MNLTHIEHIGIAVKNLNESIKFYEDILGLKCYAVEEVADQKVKTAFFQIGQTKIELLESTDPEGPIGKFIEKYIRLQALSLLKEGIKRFSGVAAGESLGKIPLFAPKRFPDKNSAFGARRD